MSTGPPVARIVDFARHAPSLHNSQPWRWRARGDVLELHADRTRQLRVADPSGRELVVSCGTALEHARVAAAALGWAAEVRSGRSGDPDHLASLRLVPARATPADHEAFRLLADRRTDRRRFTSWPVPAQRLERLARAAGEPTVTVVPIASSTDRLRLELIARRANQVERGTPGFAEEQHAWLDRGPDDGMPSATVRFDRARDLRPSRFDPAEPPVTDDVRSTDGALVLCAAEDGEDAWLLTGQVLCRLWVHALRDGLSLVPLSQPIEVDRTRAELAELLGSRGHPQLVVRIGWQELGRSPLPPTPRRSVDDVLAD